MRESLALMLKKLPVEVLALAENGKEAVQLCKELKPDLVFLDVVMSGMSGIEVLSSIRKQLPDTRIIMLTSIAARDTVIKSKELGADAYILKPYDSNLLRRHVNSVFKVINGGAS